MDDRYKQEEETANFPHPSDNTITLRGFLEMRIDYERKLFTQRQDFQERLATQRYELASRLVDQHFTGLDKARALQAEVYAHRLDVLNHAHEAAVAEQNRVVSRELFDAYKKEFEDFKLTTSKELQALTTRSITWTAAIALLITIVGIAIRFWK